MSAAAMENKKQKAPDLLRVSVRIALAIVFFGAACIVYYASGSAPDLYEKIAIYALLACIAAIVIQLAVWGLKWVANERVSELGLHIVRFAVILTVVALSVFFMMSVDYTDQYLDSVSDELCQQALASRIYVQDSIGDGTENTTEYYSGVYEDLLLLLDDSDVNAERHVNLYLFVPFDDQPDSREFFPLMDDFDIYAASTDRDIGCTASAEYIKNVASGEEVTFSEYTVGDEVCMSAFTPVFTLSGEPVGVLEFAEMRQPTSSVFGFASLQLLLTVVSLIALFSFAFYGLMQLLDILLRPKNFDKSRRVLSCGREAARPVLFFASVCAALPVMLLMFSQEMRSLVRIDFLPQQLCAIIPLVVYAGALIIGMYAVRKVGDKLTELPSNAGLITAVLCSILLLLIHDTQVFAGAKFLGHWIVTLLLIAVCGVCYGISYRTISKFQAQSDALFGYDKYIYLCSCLGAVTGVLFGAVLLSSSGEVAVKIAMIIVSACTGALSIALLEDLKTTVSTEHKQKSRLVSIKGAFLPVLPVGLSCCFVWVYLTNYLYNAGYSVTALAALTILPVVAFCFGNRMKLRTSKAQRFALVLSAVVAALAYLPMVWAESKGSAVISCAMICLAVMFVSSAVYSSMLPAERGRMFAVLAPLSLVGMMLCALCVGFFAARLSLLVVAVISLGMGGIFLTTNYPKRIAAPEVHDAITESAPAEPVPELNSYYAQPKAEETLPESESDDYLTGFAAPFVSEAPTEEPVEETTEIPTEEPTENDMIPIFPDDEEAAEPQEENKGDFSDNFGEAWPGLDESAIDAEFDSAAEAKQEPAESENNYYSPFDVVSDPEPSAEKEETPEKPAEQPSDALNNDDFAAPESPKQQEEKSTPATDFFSDDSWFDASFGSSDN